MPAPHIHPPDSDGIARAAALLREGKLVGLPTETVYGLAAHALDPEAVAAIFAAKERPFFDPLIVHVPGLAEAEALVASWPLHARKLAEAFWPGPLTLVLPKQAAVPDLVTSGLPYVALRAPAHPVAQAVLRACGLPLAAPSANRFGRISPTTAQAVAEELGDAVPLILDGGPCPIGVESTILAFPDGEVRPVLLRAGGLTVEEIEHVVGPLTLNANREAAAGNSDTTSAAAPGQLPSHYAPRTPLRRIGHPSEVPAERRKETALLAFGPLAIDEFSGFAAVENLSPTGSLPEAAARLFTLLRVLDHASAREIVALPIPETGLGLALNDRLIRAAHR